MNFYDMKKWPQIAPEKEVNVVPIGGFPVQDLPNNWL